MVVSALVVDDEADVAELFRQRLRREARQGIYVLHFANSGDEALALLDDMIEPELSLCGRTSICREWSGFSCSERSSSDFPGCR